MEKTLAQEAFELLSSVPAEDFISGSFTDQNGKCCAIGHYQRLKSANPDDFSFENCNDDKDERTFRRATRDFIQKQYYIYGDIAEVNNHPRINGYTEPVIKDRVIHLLTDMVEAGF